VLVDIWWAILCAISAVNLVAWALAARSFRRQAADMDPALRSRRQWQLVLSAIFVFVCAFRSIYPRADVQRICLHDSWWSSVLVGRSAATVAELCFVGQWVLWLRELVDGTRARFAAVVAGLLLPLILTAEIFSWYATLSTSYLGNSVEESLWTVSATLLVLAAVSLRRHIPPRPQVLMGALILVGSAYVAFMCMVDVPMYVTRWLADEAVGRHYLTLGAGLADISSRWVVTRAWDEWHTEIPWMSLYFSGGVWTSIALVRAPAVERRVRARRGAVATA